MMQVTYLAFLDGTRSMLWLKNLSTDLLVVSSAQAVAVRKRYGELTEFDKKPLTYKKRLTNKPSRCLFARTKKSQTSTGHAVEAVDGTT